MATYMLPPIALVILPLYQIMSGLDLRDTPAGPDHHLLVVRDPVRDLDHARLHRGRSRRSSTTPPGWTAARGSGPSVRVILPVSVPGLVSTGAARRSCWPGTSSSTRSIITQTNASKTLPVAINDFIGRHGVDFGLLATGGVIAALPPVIIAFVFQRYLVAGLTAGSVKG